jgi:hypothetical protein
MANVDPHQTLADAIGRLGVGKLGRLVTSRRRDWASATFSGAKHLFVYAPGERSFEEFKTGFGARLAKEDFDIPGQLVADVVVSRRVSGGIAIEALTVEA